MRAAADQIEAERELPAPVLHALVDAGLFHVLLPHQIGGLELDLPAYLEMVETIGQADASTAWCVNQAAVIATFSASLPEGSARKVWVDTPRAVLANTPIPAANAIPAPGGYRVSGPKLPFSTGCRHANWFAPRAVILDDGVPRDLPSGERDVRYFIMPAADVQILDTWSTRGLRGTGTHHFAVNDVFVPDELTVHVNAAARPGHGPLYQFPRTLLFASGDAATALGAARSCIESFLDLAGAKLPINTRGTLREQPQAHHAVGHAEAALRSGRAYLYQTARDLWTAVSASGVITLDQRSELRLATTHAIRLAAQAVDAIYNAAGATAVFESHPIQRYFQDAHVMTQHLQGRLAHYDLVGQHLLGLPIDEIVL
ncbi:MAG: acyl-CoA dehydrogenase family protein [Chloroflexota bacterium]